MSNSNLTVRGPRNEAEIAAFYEGERRGLHWDAALNGPLSDYQKLDTTSPGFQPDHFRMVFDGDNLIGGCLVSRRRVNVDGAALTTGCVGGVFTQPQYRRQGIGRLLMDQVVAYSRQRGDALLMLDGIPDYYHRWGYVDVVDLSHTYIEVDRASRLPRPSHTVREATTEDTPAMLDLYRRHYTGYTGRFERDLEYQRHLVSTTRYGNTYLRVVEGQGPNGQPSGYSFHSRRYPSRGLEVVADDWETLLALLDDQVASLPRSQEITELRWTLPQDSQEVMMLADRLTIRQETIRQPDEGWMARIVNLDAVVEAMSPVWARRWQAARMTEEPIDLQIGAEMLRLDSTGARLMPKLGETTSALTDRSFTQLLFGYRPSGYLATLPDNAIPEQSIEQLDALFPVLPGWIAATDYF